MPEPILGIRKVKLTHINMVYISCGTDKAAQPYAPSSGKTWFSEAWFGECAPPLPARANVRHVTPLAGGV